MDVQSLVPPPQKIPIDSGGLLGPKYSFADELKMPSEIGVGRGGSISNIMRSVAGINYYVDAIGFGEATMMAKEMDMNQKPLGLRYFVKTGRTCDNGADMYEYISTVPNGLPGRVGKEIQRTMGVEFRGLAPGIVEDAVGALNPLPMFNAVSGGYPKCKKVTMPVGDMEGNIQSRSDPDNVWITDPYRRRGDNLPYQTRWIYDSGVTQEEYDAVPKTEQAGVLPETEGFCNFGDSNKTMILVGLLFAALLVGLTTGKVVK